MAAAIYMVEDFRRRVLPCWRDHPAEVTRLLAVACMRVGVENDDEGYVVCIPPAAPSEVYAFASQSGFDVYPYSHTAWVVRRFSEATLLLMRFS